MLKSTLLAGVALLGFAVVPEAKAYTIIGMEDPVTGWTGNLLEKNFPGSGYLVASDGEQTFDPFKAGYDTSDGLNFSAVPHVWTQAANSSWTGLGNQTWVLPASIPGCGNENEPQCEPIGHFVSPDPWVAGAIGTFVILESDRSVSDVIRTFNTANGAELLFASDPSLPTPEPSTWAMMLIGLAGLGFAGYRGYKKPAAFAA